MATRNFVPRATNEGYLGTNSKRWNLAFLNNISYSILSVVTAAGTTTLSVTSPQIIIFTGSTTQTLVLPDATTLFNGIIYRLQNQSTGNITVQTNGGATILTILPFSDATVIVQDSSTAAGTWEIGYAAPLSLFNSSTAAVSAAYAADTYLAGSSIQIPITGSWKARTQYNCVFDMTKTGAGTGAFTVNVRMGTAGTIADASVLSLAFAVGTANADTGTFSLNVNFRSVGSGTAAVVQGMIRCDHLLAATGLVSTGAAGTGIILGTSAGFNSTTQNFIGISVNGGASFSGTNTLVQSSVSFL